MNKIEIKPLGTVSPYCKNNMNCPGFLIESEKNKILLDAGNVITSLLNFPQDLYNLNIFISHYHKDHFGDLGIIEYASYVYKNLGLIDNKIKIYLPKRDYQNNKLSITSNTESFSVYEDIDEKKEVFVDNMKISFHNNNSHTIPSYVIKVEENDIRIVYTSDIGTTNLSELISFCKDADLLICESSFVKSHNTKSTTHLTAEYAGAIARLSNVKKLLLTHFWPETDKNIYLSEATHEFENTDAAQEGKTLTLTK